MRLPRLARRRRTLRQPRLPQLNLRRQVSSSRKHRLRDSGFWRGLWSTSKCASCHMERVRGGLLPRRRCKRPDFLEYRGEESITREYAGESSQEWTASERRKVRPDQFAISLQPLKLSAAIENTE